MHRENIYRIFGTKELERILVRFDPKYLPDSCFRTGMINGCYLIYKFKIVINGRPEQYVEKYSNA